MPRKTHRPTTTFFLYSCNHPHSLRVGSDDITAMSCNDCSHRGAGADLLLFLDSSEIYVLILLMYKITTYLTADMQDAPDATRYLCSI